MKKILIVSIFLLYNFSTSGQGNFATNDTLYQSLVVAALADLEKGECKPCIEKYEKAFKKSQKSILSRLIAAVCSFECKENEKWKSHLYFALDKEWSTVENILFDKSNRYPEISKYKDSEFYTLAQSYIDKLKLKSGFNEALARELEIIELDDQTLRLKMRGDVSNDEKQKLWSSIDSLDNINIQKIEKIIEKHGYPGKSMVGKFSSTAFLVIQHSDLPIQEKYFSLLEAEVKKGELDKGSFALLVDRIRVRKGQKQLYGSQLSKKNGSETYEFDLIEDELNVNARRSEMGLGSIEEYAKHFGIEYKFPRK